MANKLGKQCIYVFGKILNDSLNILSVSWHMSLLAVPLSEGVNGTITKRKSCQFMRDLGAVVNVLVLKPKELLVRSSAPPVSNDDTANRGRVSKTG